MKNFIYLDTDYLTSALSQIYNGKVETVTDQTLNSNTETTANESMSLQNDVSLKVGIPPIFSFGLNNSSKTADPEMTLSTVETATQAVTKSFNDNMFDILEKNINASDDISSLHIGDFVKTRGTYELIDLEYTASLFSKDFLKLVVSKELIKNNIMSEYDLFNREQKRSINVDKLVDKEYKKQMDSHTNTRERIEALKIVLPEKCIFYTNGILMLINTRFLREDTASISFKYTGEINVLAQVTRVYLPEAQVEHKIKNFADMTMPIILKIFELNPRDIKYIATPIGIYFE